MMLGISAADGFVAMLSALSAVQLQLEHRQPEIGKS
jgi:hypothetical protein